MPPQTRRSAAAEPSPASAAASLSPSRSPRRRREASEPRSPPQLDANADRPRRAWWAPHVAAIVVATIGAALLTGPAAPPPTSPTPTSLWNRAMTDAELATAASAAKSAFQRSYDAYIRHGFPHDDVRPLSCRGADSQGGVALTLLDALTTALVLNDTQRLAPAVEWACGGGGSLAAAAPPLSFDVDARVHTFELTIRAMGALVSTHTYLTRAAGGYDGGLLPLAVDLADRLLPAFDTRTGLPLSWVNLRHGVVQNDTRITCTACAGTLTLEFAALSAATGNGTYRRAAEKAAAAIASRASPSTGLVGNTLHVDTGAWTRRDAGVGAGIDSFIEYELKSYLLTGDAAFLTRFTTIYAGIMRHLTPPAPPAGHHRPAWRIDADMHTGARVSPWISSLGAFFPGLQALAGQRADAAAAHADWAAAWARFGGLPEMLDAGGTTRHPGAAAYPLRPELAESSYVLHAVTQGHPVYRATGAMMATSLETRCRAPCGYASLSDVATGAREDTMESFVLSETFKYLWLLFTPGAADLLDAAVLTTEGHPLPPLPRADGRDPAPLAAPSNSTCSFLCDPLHTPDDWAARVATRVGGVLPLLAPTAAEVTLLRSRRCAACLAVDAAMAGVRAAVKAEEEAAAAAARPLAQVVCRLAVREERVGGASSAAAAPAPAPSPAPTPSLAPSILSCASLERVPPADVPVPVADLPRDALVVQLMARGGGAGAPSPTDQATCDGGDADSLLPPDAPVTLHVTALGSKGEALVDLPLTGLAAAFGPRLESGAAVCAPGNTVCTVSGRLVAADPPDACAPLKRAPPAGAVVAVDRGACPFERKVMHAAAAGAGAVVVLSDDDEDFTMAPAAEDGDDDDSGSTAEDGDDDDSGSTAHHLVPSLLLARAAADSLRSALSAAGDDAVVTAALRPAAHPATPPSASTVTVVLPPRTARWVAARVPGGDARPALAALLPSLVTSPELKRLLALD